MCHINPRGGSDIYQFFLLSFYMYMVTIIYLRSQYAYNVAFGELLASMYRLIRIEYGVDQSEEVCIIPLKKTKDNVILTLQVGLIL